MGLAEVIMEARTHFIDGKIEDGDVYVFECRDGLLIINQEEDVAKATVVAGGKVISLKETLDIETESKTPDIPSTPEP